MERTIKVKGVGRISRRPDQVCISLNYNAEDVKYDKAFDNGGEKLAKISKALTDAGFEPTALKTTSFNVYPQYKEVRRGKETESVFSHYRCSGSADLRFPFDPALLGKAMDAIQASGAEASMNINFELKDPKSADRELLAKAAKNALEKAECTVTAAGAKLGRLISIDYDWQQHSYVRGLGMERMVFAKAAVADSMNPEDIQDEDSAVFIWEIVD